VAAEDSIEIGGGGLGAGRRASRLRETCGGGAAPSRIRAPRLCSRTPRAPGFSRVCHTSQRKRMSSGRLGGAGSIGARRNFGPVSAVTSAAERSPSAADAGDSSRLSDPWERRAIPSRAPGDRGPAAAAAALATDAVVAAADAVVAAAGPAPGTDPCAGAKRVAARSSFGARASATVSPSGEWAGRRWASTTLVDRCSTWRASNTACRISGRSARRGRRPPGAPERAPPPPDRLRRSRGRSGPAPESVTSATVNPPEPGRPGPG
jgi:hypothetical protein